jgi:hypothetical protein
MTSNNNNKRPRIKKNKSMELIFTISCDMNDKKKYLNETIFIK